MDGIRLDRRVRHRIIAMFLALNYSGVNSTGQYPPAHNTNALLRHSIIRIAGLC